MIVCDRCGNRDKQAKACEVTIRDTSDKHKPIHNCDLCDTCISELETNLRNFFTKNPAEKEREEERKKSAAKEVKK
jgi:hypothetical protein